MRNARENGIPNPEKPKFFHIAVCDSCGVMLVGPTDNVELCNSKAAEHDLISHDGLPTAKTIGFDHYLGGGRYV